MAANNTNVTVTLDAESKRLLRRIADALDGGSSADRAFADADRDERDPVGHVRFTEHDAPTGEKQHVEPAEGNIVDRIRMSEDTSFDPFTHWEG